ncbi:MAG: hypothetical protein HZC50_08085 [Nitrospirae bacterium]|nr:hypothetical protein [Nitrospirota bacterium]
MDVSYDDIRPTFEKVRHNFSYDLNLLKSQILGGNYITALLIACACETLSRYRYGEENGVRFFSEKMLPDEWRPVAPSLFDTIRNGIAHSFETKSIRIGDSLLDICISWRQQPHLHFSPDKKVLYLNIQTMAEQILDLLREYEESLVVDSQLRLQLSKAMRADWTKKPTGDELKAWKNLLGAET